MQFPTLIWGLTEPGWEWSWGPAHHIMLCYSGVKAWELGKGIYLDEGWGPTVPPGMGRTR